MPDVPVVVQDSAMDDDAKLVAHVTDCTCTSFKILVIAVMLTPS